MKLGETPEAEIAPGHMSYQNLRIAFSARLAKSDSGLT